jgi:ketosteroid isomerase-like protein
VGRPLGWPAMTQPAAAVVREFFDLFARGGVDAALERVAPDAVLVVPPSMSAEPDTYEGHEGARRYFQGFDGVIDDVSFCVRELVEATDETALVVLEVRGLGAESRIPIALDAVLECRLRDGRIARLIAHPDLESARESRA